MAEDNAPVIRRTDAAPATIGRTPPHSIEAEEYLLSCCLLDGSDSIARCLEAKLPSRLMTTATAEVSGALSRKRITTRISTMRRLLRSGIFAIRMGAAA